ncbi:ELOV4 protein, partial [Acromyrmex insinuator]
VDEGGILLQVALVNYMGLPAQKELTKWRLMLCASKPDIPDKIQLCDSRGRVTQFARHQAAYEETGSKTIPIVYRVMVVWLVVLALGGWVDRWVTVQDNGDYKRLGEHGSLFGLLWWLIFLKLFDYVETCVFVLRKKQNQVSGLHLYHHVSNLVFLWYFLKYIVDERATFCTLINCTVHVIMYMYYFIAALSPELQQMISPIKQLVTKLQMVQFIIMIVSLMQFVNPNCELPRGIATIFVGNLFVFLYLFYDFHKKTYTKLSKQKDN